MKRLAPGLALLLALPALAADPQLTVTGGKADEANVVCKLVLPPPADPTRPESITGGRLPDGTVIPIQGGLPSVLDPRDRSQVFTFTLAKLRAGETLARTRASRAASSTASR